MTQPEIEVANDFPRNGPERLVLPGLDVASAPVVDEHDAEDVIAERRRRNRRSEHARHADDESQLELDVESPTRPEARRRVVGRLRLAGGSHDRRSADDDRSRAAVVADRKMTPVRKQRIGIGAKETAEVGGVLERRVEVDVVGDLERKVNRRLLERNDVAASLDQLDHLAESVLPRRSPRSEERIQARLRELRTETARHEVENAVTCPKADPGLVPGDREDAKPDRPVHSGRIPEFSSSSTGSKKLQLPIECTRSRRARTSSSPRARAVSPREGSWIQGECIRITFAEGGLLVAEDDRGQQVEKPVLAVAPQRVVETGRRLERDPALATGANETRQGVVVGRRRASAAHLRAQTMARDRVQAFLQRVVERNLDIDLVRDPDKCCKLGSRRSFDRLDPGVRLQPDPALEVVEHHADPSPHVRQLG